MYGVPPPKGTGKGVPRPPPPGKGSKGSYKDAWGKGKEKGDKGKSTSRGTSPGKAPPTKTAKAAAPACRGAKVTTSNKLDFKDMYALPIYNKQDLLFNLDRRQFNNKVVCQMPNDDLTDIIALLADVDPCDKPQATDSEDPRGKYLAGLLDNIWLRLDGKEITGIHGKKLLAEVRHWRAQKEELLQTIAVYYIGDDQCISCGDSTAYLPAGWNYWCETIYRDFLAKKPYITDGTNTRYVEEFVTVPDLDPFEFEEAPGSPASMVSQAEPGPEHLVVYDTAGKALLVKVLDPTQMVELPPTDAKDYFVQKHHTNKREFVSSPSVGFMSYADELLAKREPEGEPAEAKSSPHPCCSWWYG